MKKDFSLKYKNDKNISPVEIFKKNLLELEILCKQANKENFQIVLHSPDKIFEPQNVYELSVLLAEDMVKKFSNKNEIVR
ncbi:MAG TPA: hypothetical protein PKI94_02125 [Candidatus Gastranaerophilaceae bacterium]|nr:hypothetical protein [Candidatus Gastranaerophilaceae bacterium]